MTLTTSLQLLVVELTGVLFASSEENDRSRCSIRRRHRRPTELYPWVESTYKRLIERSSTSTTTRDGHGRHRQNSGQGTDALGVVRPPPSSTSSSSSSLQITPTVKHPPRPYQQY